MPRIKHTKNELKAQRDALKRFERYLPTLQLKKQQLQMEVRRLEGQIEQKKAEEEKLRGSLKTWVRLFADPFPFGQHLKVAEVRASEGNIAGIAIPVLEDVRFDRKVPDLFLTPSWVDDGMDTLDQLLRLSIERRILDEQHRRLAEELRVTSQRVNLFEKVKIPECGENIRVIRIFLGDEQTADVVRGKIAKGRTVETT
ncbi:MAG: V-type ATP synthase subunit D [Kiritimatiellae bacterium]|nr:V-type ATP synthase subunit D [Kiritimatiellia bacterium]